MELPERIKSKIRFSFARCWEWTAAKTHGYGILQMGTHGKSKTRNAHIIVYELMAGPVPPGLELDHLCRNPGCVRPSHLQPVTHRENCLRGTGISARMARKTVSVCGHPFDATDEKGGRICYECRKKNALRNYYRRKAAAALGFLLVAASSLAQLPPYKTTDFRSVTDTSNNITSIPLCGSDGRGIFFNSSDQQAGSCIDGSAFQPAWLLSGSQLYVPLGSALTALRETSCYTAAYQGGCTSYGLQKCGTAKLWQVFHVPDMAYIGQSDTAGGPPTPVQKVSIVCPTPTPAATRTATVTPKPVSPVSTPTRPSSLTPTASQSPSCATPTPTPTPTPIPCGVVR